MHEDLAEILRTWKRNGFQVNGWVFGNIVTGRPFRGAALGAYYLKPAGIRMGIANFGWHSLRHTYRVAMRQLNIPLEAQKDLMGHSALPTTMLYGADDPHRVEELRPENARIVERFRKKVG